MSLHSSLNGLGYGDMAESMKAYLQKFWVLKLMGKPFPSLEKTVNGFRRLPKFSIFSRPKSFNH